MIRKGILIVLSILFIANIETIYFIIYKQN